MGLPITFLLGAALLLLHDQLRESLPGASRPAQFLPFLLLVPLPWLLVRAFTRVVRRRGLAGRWGYGRGVGLPLSGVLRLLPWSVPAAYAAMVLLGDLPPVASAWAGESSLLFLLGSLLPLLAMEVTYRLAERRLLAVGERLGIPLPAAPGDLPLVWLVVLPVVLMAALADVARGHRGLHVFLSSTALGQLCGFLVTVLVLSVALPLLFRWLLPTSRRLPPSVASDVLATARALGFPPRAVLALHTDLRVPNAALVGPLPWPRYLVLTDALIEFLDPLALRGVVAHEVGHARAGHPGLLLLTFVVVPILLFHTVWLSLIDASSSTTAIVLGCLFGAALVLLRLVAHRFEYEADQQSAAALGGAEPCIEALRRVGQLGARGAARATLRHPADARRVAQLQRWEQEEGERARFARRGRRVRVLIAGVVAAAVLLSAWSQIRVWPIDRAVIAYYTGAFADAGQRLATLPDFVPPVLAEQVRELQDEVSAALALVPSGGPWDAVQDRLAEGGIERAADLLRAGAVRAALPWLSLSLSRPAPEPWRQTLYLIARAAIDGDAERLARLRRHLEEVGPPDVAQLVANLEPLPVRTPGSR